MALLYTNDNEAEKENRETSNFAIATNNIKYLEATLIKEMKDLFDHSIKSLKKEIEEIAENGNISHAHGQQRST